MPEFAKLALFACATSAAAHSVLSTPAHVSWPVPSLSDEPGEPGTASASTHPVRGRLGAERSTKGVEAREKVCRMRPLLLAKDCVARAVESV